MGEPGLEARHGRLLQILKVRLVSNVSNEMGTYYALGVWTIDWMMSDLTLPSELFSEQTYPNVFSWRNRFRSELVAARENGPTPLSLEGVEAVAAILGAEFTDKDLFVDQGDPMQLSEGSEVELFPTDGGGYTHQDRGRLIKLTKDEVAIAVQSEQGREVHVHA